MRIEINKNLSEKTQESHPFLSWAFKKMANFAVDQGSESVEVADHRFYSIGYLTGTPYGTIPVTFGILGMVFENCFAYEFTFDQPQVKASIEVRNGKRTLMVANTNSGDNYSCSLYFTPDSENVDKTFDLDNGFSVAITNAGKLERLKSFFKNDKEKIVNLENELPASAEWCIRFTRGTRWMKTMYLKIDGDNVAVTWQDPEIPGQNKQSEAL